MTFAQVFTALEAKGVLPASRVKDIKTSLRYLAQALGHSSPEECQMGEDGLDPSAWTDALETHFRALEAQGRSMSAATRRNTRNNLRVLFRLAEEHGVLAQPMPSRLLKKSHRHRFKLGQWESNPYKDTYSNDPKRRYWLPQSEWPPDIQAGFQEYRVRCGLSLREVTFNTYVKCLSTYLGYFANIVGQPLTWESVFELAHVLEFVRWHAARLQRSSTVHGQTVAIKVATMAKRLEHPQASTLTKFIRGLKPPAPTHTKRAHWVTLKTLEEAANACLEEGRTPYTTHKTTRSPGAQRAVHFQRGVILKLLVRVPLRQRNVREMQLDKHLYKDQDGHWHIEFRGDELKIGNRGPLVNIYHVDLTEYCPEWLPLLEEFLTVYRCRFPGAAASKFVFLTMVGNPHSAKTLHEDISTGVAMRTGQRFFPHLARSIWATEYLEDTGDFATAAVMLGDTIGTVMKTYYDMVHKNHHAKAKGFLATKLHP
jgi:hypothetical protein